MIRVGLFIDTYFPMVDGVIHVVHNYAERLNGSEFEVVVFCPRTKEKDYKDNFSYKVVRCKSVKIFFLDYSLPLPQFDKKFKRALKDSNLDIVHIHSPFGVAKAGIKYARKKGIPVIASMHSQFEQDFYRATHSKLITKILLKSVMKVFNRCDICYAVSPAVSEIFLRYGAKVKPPYMYTGTDMKPAENRGELIDTVNEKYGFAPDMPVFIFVGRITVLKNVLFLAEALSKLKDKNFKAVFVGDGKDMPTLKKQIARLGLEGNAVFTGRMYDREELKALYCRAKLCLFPSMYDTNSLVQKEAASQSTPTVFLEGAATASNVTDGVNGFISPADPESYAAKIESVLSDDELYERVCKNAFRDLFRSWEQAVEELKEAYLSAIEKVR